MLQRLAACFPTVLRRPMGFKPVMDVDEARKILAIEPRGQSALQRYMQMMRINHPDRGGSPYIASKINEAKALLADKHPELF